ncbi:MAG TPA: NAD-dependent epimerase/dehydratase family protein [Coriobacteriia bacterium]
MIDIGTSLAGSRCVVFGGTGFLGSHIVSALLAADAEVVVFDLRQPRAGAHSGGREPSSVVGDVADPDAVRGVIDGADHIFAFAGGSGAVRSLANPLADLRTSCQAQLVLLESMREVAPHASVVFPGSRLEYGKVHRLPVAEDHPLHGTSPYALHKIACDGYHHIYAEAHGLHTIVLRISNPYGAHTSGDAARHGYGIVNRFVDSAMAGETIPLYGGGGQLRDLVFVDDVVRAVLLASVADKAWGTAVNIGSGVGVSLRSMAEAVVAEVGNGAVDVDAEWPPDAAAVETGDFYFDVSLAAELLGWAPRVGIDEGVRRLVEAARS